MKIRFFTGILILLILCRCNKDDQPLLTEVRLGAILDLSGDYSEEGQAGKAAIELSIKKLNQRYEQVGSPLRFSCEFMDAQLDSSLNVQAAKRMFEDSIRLLVGGPNNSAMLKAIRPFVNENKILTLCTFSSSPALSIAGDWIYRFITDDNVQGRALVRMMQYDNIRALVPVWRKDTYGNGVYETVRNLLEPLGIEVLAGVSYSPGETAYQGMVEEISRQVESAGLEFNLRETGIMLVTYQEASEFLRVAAGTENLAKVRWYGCDANVQKAVIVQDPAIAKFAADVRFIAPIMGIGDANGTSENAAELSDQIFRNTGLPPDAYALSAFDAVQVMGLAVDLVQSDDAGKIREILPGVCGSYDFLGISRRLNDAGDMYSANYIFWAVTGSASGYSWTTYSTYMAGLDLILLKSR